MQRYNDQKINKHYVYLDAHHNPLVLPCLFARYTQVLGHRIDSITEVTPNTKQKSERFAEHEIGDDTSYKICNHLGRFLEWVDKYKDSNLVALSKHTALPNEVINEYINEYLIGECESSEFVAKQAVNSLDAYYLWLFYFFGNRRKHIGIKSAYRESARNNSRRELAIKYLLPETRQLLYRSTDTLLEEIVLRNGGELGCRTKENQGFLLNDYKANKKTHEGLLSLFCQLKTNPTQSEFKFVLSSLFTKYGRARTLYISRDLLEKMKLYYDTERPHSDSNHLLVSSSNSSFGRCISRAFGSDTFRKTREKLIQKIHSKSPLYSRIQEISSENTYHNLRHSFGTDIFYELCLGQNKNYESITTTSAIYLETALRLGHKVDAKFANTVTKHYISSCGFRERLLKEVLRGG